MEEANRRARITGNSTIKYWFENEIETDVSEMPIPHYRPISYIKVCILWAFYYLKNNHTYEEAMRDIIKRGGDVHANSAIIGGLLGAAVGVEGVGRERI
jgi:hypothetical protein